MIKAVLFDFGGVLTEGGKAGAVRKIFADVYGVDPDSLRSYDVGMKALTGMISDEEFLRLSNAVHPNAPPVTKEYFLQTVDILQPCEQVYRLAGQLRKNGIQTAIMSNIFAMVADVLRARGLYDNFQPVLLSCNEHVAKPDPAFYALALDRLHLRPEEVLLIDDQDTFLRPAARLGMYTILATSPSQIVEATKQLFRQENNLQLGMNNETRD